MATKTVAIPDNHPSKYWGYVVVASVFLINFLYIGWFQLQAFFFVEWQRYFDTTSLEASLLVSTGLVVLGFASTLGGFLATLFGSRVVVMAGGLIVSLGMACTMLMDSITGIILTWGVLKGFGFGLLYSPSIAMIRQYFNEHLTIANGVAYTGASLGQISIPLVANYLIEAFGWRGAAWLLSAVMFHLVLCGVVLKPNHIVADYSGKTESIVTTFAHDNNAYEHDKESMLSQRIAVASVSAGIIEADKTVLQEETLTNRHHNGTASETTNTKLNFDRNIDEDCMFVLKALITNIRFDILLVVCFIFGVVFFAPLVHSVPRALKDGINIDQAALLPVMFGIGGLIGRLWPSFIADIFHVPIDLMNICAFLICTVANLLNPLFSSILWLQSLYSFVYGMATGTIMVLTFTILQVILSSKECAAGVGFANGFFTVGTGIGSLLTGWIVDSTGSYDLAYCILGASSGLGALLSTLVAYLTRRTLKAKSESSLC